MFSKKALHEAKLKISLNISLDVVLASGKEINVRLSDGAVFDDDNFRLDDHSASSEKIVQEFVKENLFK